MTLWLFVNALLVLCAYVLGSVPSGYLAGRWLKGIDIREHGSGSMGATNVLRTLGKIPAAAVFLVDVCKGALAIAIVKWIFTQSDFLNLAGDKVQPTDVLPWVVTLAGFFALLGHSKPIWLRFKGGKSVASSLGVLLALSWPVALGTAGVFAFVFAFSRIVSLSSMLGAIATSVWMVVFQEPLAYLLFGIIGGIYVVWLHRANIQRLMAGAEPKVGQKLPEAVGSPEKT